MAIARALQQLSLSVWIDSERLAGNILGQITRGVEESIVFVVCVTPTYMAKVQAGAEERAENDWCAQEFSYAHDVLGASRMMAVVVDAAALNPKTWVGPVRFVLGGALYVDASSADKVQTAALEISMRIARQLV